MDKRKSSIQEHAESAAVADYDQAMSLTLKHQFLLAMPALEDENFAHTVTYVCQHDSQGALGIIVNKPAPMRLQELMESLGLDYLRMDDPIVLMGGPVNPAHGFILHTPLAGFDLSVDLGNGLMFSTAKDLLAAIGRNEGPEKFLIALGYAGWSGGQLETEVGQNAWLTCPASERVLFDVPLPERVREAASSLGIDFNLIASRPGFA